MVKNPYPIESTESETNYFKNAIIENVKGFYKYEDDYIAVDEIIINWNGKRYKITPGGEYAISINELK